MLCGGIQQADPKNESAQEAITLAIKQHNEKENDNLVFQKIDELTSQVVAGSRFRATIECLKDNAVKHYYIDIWCKPGANYPKDFEVKEFKPKD
ncbi:hypothetical protein M9Y10_021548 [Tritrichomonas musculus]|uniref:Cystatin domain-containing protein n=1 Tax=Tritrichomonas musculus TaxID=1915356 RepID=A0ABR2KQN2_9EUKA